MVTGYLRKEMSTRLLLLFFGLISGAVIGYFFNLIWLVVKGYILGYGDSGPEWVGTISNLIWIVTISICVIVSQWLFGYLKKRGKIK